MTVPSRIGLAALLGAGFVPCITGSASAAPAEAPTEIAAPVAPQTPSTPVSEVSPPADPAPETAPVSGAGPAAEPPAEGDVAAVPEAPPAAEPEPEPPLVDETAREGSDTATAEEMAGPATGPEKSEPIDPDLLKSESSDPEQSTPQPTTRRVVKDPAAYEAALLASYDAEYRPADNPARLHVGARALFAYAGGDKSIGGRMGGAQVDIGQAWNRFGYALTASAWGGRILLGDRVAELNGLFGAGPTLTFGRTALQQRGLIDLRLGYDFMYGVVNQRTDTGTVLGTTSQSGSNVVIEQTENLLPHGPRAMLQLGLLSQVKRDYHHGFGIVFGYQGLVGSLRGNLPFTHMLVTGLQWWMG